VEASAISPLSYIVSNHATKHGGLTTKLTCYQSDMPTSHWPPADPR